MNKSYITLHFKTSGLKMTAQRSVIIDVLLRHSREHINLEQILAEARANNPAVSGATVFRNIVFLEKTRLISKMKLQDNKSYYQLQKAGTAEGHHDHLLCEKCGKIVEFYSEKLEKLQEKVASENGFEISRHRMELYGVCRTCRTKNK
ncbi:MAG TPA: transcriptional repressor [Candidatus Wallbacteria bacterium]|nr:transcriptional repressor [Candidatus Wallbacteria bacterium]